MNYSKSLECAIKLQDSDIDLGEIPINIFLKNTCDVLSLCFIEIESDDCLIVAETNSNGNEEIRVIPKENIEYISVFYDIGLLIDDVEFDNMFV